MRTSNIILITVTGILVSFSFQKSKTNLLVGKYGDCGCSDENLSGTKTELSFYSDSTYHYYDNSTETIDIKGEWTLKNNIILLSNTVKSSHLPSKWKLDNSNPCITSKKGITFFRLCHIDSCNTNSH